MALFVGVIALAPTAFSTPTTVRSDAGVFYSMFHQLAQGRRLYTDVFDHKDPLFYVAHTVAYATVGPIGPMLWETVLSASLIVGIVALAGRLGLTWAGRVCVAATFVVLHFLPSIYVPMHTYQQGIALLIWSLVAASRSWSLVAGLLLGAAIFSKLPLAASGPAVLLLCILGPVGPESWSVARRRAGRLALGVATTAAFVLGALALRGELAGFVDAVLQNIAYPTLNPASASSFERGATLWGRATALFGAPPVALYLGLLGVSAAGLATARGARRVAAAPHGGRIAGSEGRASAPGVAASKIGGAASETGDPAHGPANAPRRRAAPWSDPAVNAAVLALALGGATGVMLLTASWWSHHFQIAALAGALALAPPLLLFGRLPRPASVAATVALPGVVLGLLATPSLAGSYAVQSPDLRAADPCEIVLRAQRRTPSRRECGLLGETWPAGTRFATIQQNDPGSLAAWTPPGMHLACRLFYQFPWLRPELLDELAACLERGDIDVVFRAPLRLDVPRLQARLERVMARDFALVRRHGEIEVWQRR